MEVTFVRARGRQDWVHVTRSDGSVVKWPWVKAGGQLPHDLVHYLVETGLGLTDGFWGLVADGVDFGFLTEQADRIARGAPLQGLAGRDLTGLIAAECVVAGISSAGFVEADPALCLEWIGQNCARRDQAVPAGVTVERVDAVVRRIRETTAQWHRLPEGDSLTVAYPPLELP